MYARHLAPYLLASSQQYPIVTVTGPRQSGKTTLVKHVFPSYRYVSLEDPDLALFAQTDPRGFLQTYDRHVILDEIQNVPQLFSYLQTHTDACSDTAQYILSGSQQFLLNEKIAQSLSGRTAILRLIPLSLSELLARPPQTYWQNSTFQSCSQPAHHDLYQILFQGMYPRLHAYAIPPSQFYRDYVDTYLNRDVRALIRVGDMNKFQLFLRLVAGRCGQLVNFSSLGNDVGVDQTTIRRWLTVLEASYVIYLIQPCHANFNKRMIKSAKIYFLDSGLLCYLLRINNSELLQQHPLIGGIFETFVFSELYKNFSNHNQEAPLYYWRDRSEREIDIMIDRGSVLLPIEIKSTQTITPALFKNIHYWMGLSGQEQTTACLVYAGNVFQQHGSHLVIPWYAIS